MGCRPRPADDLPTADPSGLTSASSLPLPDLESCQTRRRYAPTKRLLLDETFRPRQRHPTPPIHTKTLHPRVSRHIRRLSRAPWAPAPRSRALSLPDARRPPSPPEYACPGAPSGPRSHLRHVPPGQDPNNFTCGHPFGKDPSSPSVPSPSHTSCSYGTGYRHQSPSHTKHTLISYRRISTNPPTSSTPPKAPLLQGSRHPPPPTPSPSSGDPPASGIPVTASDPALIEGTRIPTPYRTAPLTPLPRRLTLSDPLPRYPFGGGVPPPPFYTERYRIF
ncbi:hypothetical protein llap_22889 [Limosa lapponica baueri]|uniref:Uncharacterized protein n=1 Tax=Limosa lapponica baueri TaxID=1758121 RepID=A0A2I0SZ24_LIMLA|nr:hypothetical protein llap_22889 [Limosa lapponica baueri]